MADYNALCNCEQALDLQAKLDAVIRAYQDYQEKAAQMGRLYLKVYKEVTELREMCAEYESLITFLWGELGKHLPPGTHEHTVANSVKQTPILPETNT